MMQRLLNVADEKEKLNAKERAKLEKATGINLSSGSEAAGTRNASKESHIIQEDGNLRKGPKGTSKDSTNNAGNMDPRLRTDLRRGSEVEKRGDKRDDKRDDKRRSRSRRREGRDGRDGGRDGDRRDRDRRGKDRSNSRGKDRSNSRDRDRKRGPTRDGHIKGKTKRDSRNRKSPKKDRKDGSRTRKSNRDATNRESGYSGKPGKGKTGDSRESRQRKRKASSNHSPIKRRERRNSDAKSEHVKNRLGSADPRDRNRSNVVNNNNDKNDPASSSNPSRQNSKDSAWSSNGPFHKNPSKISSSPTDSDDTENFISSRPNHLGDDQGPAESPEGSSPAESPRSDESTPLESPRNSENCFAISLQRARDHPEMRWRKPNHKPGKIREQKSLQVFDVNRKLNPLTSEF
jgi:hypothetical protein